MMRATPAQDSTRPRVQRCGDRRVGEVVVVDQVVAINGAYVVPGVLQCKLSQIRVCEKGVRGRPCARRWLCISTQWRREVACFFVFVKIFLLFTYPFVDKACWSTSRGEKGAWRRKGVEGVFVGARVGLEVVHRGREGREGKEGHYK
jgi:hypothetical protein